MVAYDPDQKQGSKGVPFSLQTLKLCFSHGKEPGCCLLMKSLKQKAALDLEGAAAEEQTFQCLRPSRMEVRSFTLQPHICCGITVKGYDPVVCSLTSYTRNWHCLGRGDSLLAEGEMWRMTRGTDSWQKSPEPAQMSHEESDIREWKSELLLL